MNMERFITRVVVCLIAICATGAAAQDSKALAAGVESWQDALAAFAAADREERPPAGGVLFVGSSSIRLWKDLERDFREAPVVIKRGFGGSRLTDCVLLLDRLVIQYRPRHVVLYAGDNDLAEGSTPQQVVDRVKAFTEGVRRRLPETEVSFISIKPSPARRALIPKIREANQLVREYADAEPGLDYIDVFTPMLSDDGSPRRELFRQDALHLNEAGYALWRSTIRPLLH